MKNFKKVLSKTFEKGLSKTVAPLYFADTYAHRHTWIPHKARCRFSNDGYGTPYPNTPSRGVTREGYAKYTLYLIKRGVAL
ncbi:MAG: hypothetical protein Q8O41_07550 [Candidatus Methanoperedens sp.]|nr:hypothetical protein [Candidatus Methanoperedens sp.]